ncbi:MAG TPA: hypothetical protein VKV77_08765 [Methylovirgula sp.]|nr:hypothetical protein [Methylovirgula sp.]
MVLALVTLAALFCCYEFEVLPGDTKPYALELDEVLLVSTIFCGGLFICALRYIVQLQGRFSTSSCDCSMDNKQVGPKPLGRPSKAAEIEAAIDALAADGIDLSKLARKDAYSRILQKAAKHGANVDVGFSIPVIQRALVRRYGPRA